MFFQRKDKIDYKRVNYLLQLLDKTTAAAKLDPFVDNYDDDIHEVIGELKKEMGIRSK